MKSAEAAEIYNPMLNEHIVTKQAPYTEGNGNGCKGLSDPRISADVCLSEQYENRH
jgi:hypothetical protein